MLVALAAAVTLTSVAAAGPDAAKQRVAIDMKIHPQKTSYSRRSGRTPEARLGHDQQQLESIPGREVMRDGQKVWIYDGAVTTLTGKQEPSRFATGTSGSSLQRETGYGYGDSVAFGTWKAVRGLASTPGSPERTKRPCRPR